MITESAVELSRRRVAALALRVGGVLVWIAALVHFFALPLLRDSVAPSLSGRAYNFVWPILSFAFSLDGVLLLPLGFTAIYCAAGIQRGEQWARPLGLVCALTVLTLPRTPTVATARVADNPPNRSGVCGRVLQNRPPIHRRNRVHD